MQIATEISQMRRCTLPQHHQKGLSSLHFADPYLPFSFSALGLLDTLNPTVLDSPEVTSKILGDRPNTYTFTKVRRVISVNKDQ
jgi:hypothetical protein